MCTEILGNSPHSDEVVGITFQALHPAPTDVFGKTSVGAGSALIVRRAALPSPDYEVQ